MNHKLFPALCELWELIIASIFLWYPALAQQTGEPSVDPAEFSGPATSSLLVSCPTNSRCFLVLQRGCLFNLLSPLDAVSVSLLAFNSFLI